MTTRIGIDPGLSGAIAIVRGKELHCEDLPIKLYRTREMIDADKLWRLLDYDDLRQASVVVEWVNPQPKFGAITNHSLGSSLGVIFAVLDLLSLNYDMVRPQDWQKVVLRQYKDRSKSSAIAFVRKHFGLPDSFIIRHDRADAACIALYPQFKEKTG